MFDKENTYVLFKPSIYKEDYDYIKSRKEELKDIF